MPLHIVFNLLILNHHEIIPFTATPLFSRQKQQSLNQRVPGSSPGAPTISSKTETPLRAARPNQINRGAAADGDSVLSVAGGGAGARVAGTCCAIRKYRRQFLSERRTPTSPRINAHRFDARSERARPEISEV
jgi:hypothetical protein